MTRVALVLPELLPVPPVQGGAVEQWIHEATRRLDPAHLSVTVIARPAGVAGWPGVSYLGVPWTPLERWFQQVKNKVSRRNPLRALAKVQNVWSYGWRLRAALAGFDVVCLENDPNLLLFVKPRPGQRVVLHMHNEHLGIRALRPLYGRLLAKADLVLCVSDYIRRQACAVFPEHAHRFQVLINGADADFFKPRPAGEALSRLENGALLAGAPLVVYVGRLTADKGVHVLLKAFAEVAGRHPQARLVITGSSFFGGAARTPYQDHLLSLVGELQDRVVFTGFLKQEQVAALMAAASAVVVPSVWQDPCPLVVLEAMASGAAVIATRVGGIPEMLCEDGAGVLVPADDAPALATALDEVLANPARAAAMGRAARELVTRKFSWAGLAMRFQSALEGGK